MKVLTLLWGLVPVSYRIWAGLGSLAVTFAVLGGVYYWIWHQGEQHGIEITTVKYERQMAEIEKANKAVIDDANTILRHAIQQNQTIDKENEDVVQHLEKNAEQAPADAPIAIGVDRLRELARIH